MAELEKTNPNSPLLELASLLTELLKDSNQKNISSSTQDISPEENIPTIDLDPPSREVIPPRDSKQSAEPSTPHQPTIEQLTQELAQSIKRNEGYVKLIAGLQEENKELWLQVKNIEELHRTISLSQRNQQERCTLLKA